MVPVVPVVSMCFPVWYSTLGGRRPFHPGFSDVFSMFLFSPCLLFFDFDCLQYLLMALCHCCRDCSVDDCFGGMPPQLRHPLFDQGDNSAQRLIDGQPHCRSCLKLKSSIQRVLSVVDVVVVIDVGLCRLQSTL